ncbi:hypothetical protein HK097_004711 [Rhizophlyctis rosea]|uniref:Ion transport domain-containing protein n=1 Tax=Rhizophlyctis rosea TaxID=64517 RepID=A0AAD5WZC2_9FUNG|nr:hypothetical protein HK097_004711 [Rhizophlyctis rosea]
MDPDGDETAFLTQESGLDRSTWSNAPQTTTSTRMGRSERYHSIANRILHSQFYKVFYLGMVLISVICLIVSISSRCPPGWFYFLEIIVNLSMIAEVAVRFLALRNLFWKSLWNIGDVLLVGLCVITLLVLGFGECGASGRKEAVAEEIVLVIRNAAQLVRLVRMMAKNRRQLTTRNTNIDFGSIIGTSPNNLAPDILPGGTLSSYDAPIGWDDEDDDFL